MKDWIIVRKFPVLEVLCLILLGVSLYFGTLDQSFHFDDKQNIWNNSSIQITSLSLDKLLKAGFEGNLAKRPVANISFALNYYFHGLDVRGYHAVNILIHLLGGILLFYFVRITLDLPFSGRREAQSRFIPLFTALIWLLHPLQTQSVNYIVQRMNSLAAMFFIMAMLFYVLARITPEQMKKALFSVFSVIAGFLAIGSKENAITLPLFILLYECYFLQDLRLKLKRHNLIWIIAIAFLFLFVLYFFLGNSPLGTLTSGYAYRTFTLSQRLLTEPRVILHYVSLLFFPYPGRLTLDYDFPLSHSLLDPTTTLFAIIMLVGVLGIAIYMARRNRIFSFCILWFFGNLVVESSTIGLEIIYEHRMYLPSMMAILLAVTVFDQLIWKREAVIVCLVSVIILFSYWTHVRNQAWQDELSLWVDTREKSPNKARVLQNLGTAYLNAGMIDEAIPIYRKALEQYMQEIRLQPRVSARLTSFHLRNLGTAYKKKGEFKKAIVYLNRAVQEFPFDAETYFDLGYCYTRTWQLEEAVYNLTKALEFSQHHSADLVMQANVENIKTSLDKAKQLLREKEKRQELRQNNIKS